METARSPLKDGASVCRRQQLGGSAPGPASSRGHLTHTQWPSGLRVRCWSESRGQRTGFSREGCRPACPGRWAQRRARNRPDHSQGTSFPLMLRSYHQRNLCPLPERTKGENHSQQHLGPDSRCRRRLRGLTWPRTGLCARATRRLVGQGRGLQEGWGEGRRTRTRRARVCTRVCACVHVCIHVCA